MIWGKHYKSMYEGSMVGAGAHVFALMGYIIANMEADPVVGAQVRLNPVLLSVIFGETEQRIADAIGFLCSPDAKSTSPDDEGRRIVKVGQFDYRVVNGAKYIAIRNAEAQKDANRLRQANYRAKKPRKRDLDRVRKENDSRLERFEAADANGDQQQTDEIAAEGISDSSHKITGQQSALSGKVAS